MQREDRVSVVERTVGVVMSQGYKGSSEAGQDIECCYWSEDL